jgi:hypothetical protein
MGIKTLSPEFGGQLAHLFPLCGSSDSYDLLRIRLRAHEREMAPKPNETISLADCLFFLTMKYRVLYSILRLH